MREVAVGEETGIGTAATVGKIDRVITSADSNFKKRVDIFVRVGRRGGITVRQCSWSWFEISGESSTSILNHAGVDAVPVGDHIDTRTRRRQRPTPTPRGQRILAFSPDRCSYQENVLGADKGTILR